MRSGDEHHQREFAQLIACLLPLDEDGALSDQQVSRFLELEVQFTADELQRARVKASELEQDRGPLFDKLYMSEPGTTLVHIDLVDLSLSPRNLQLRVGDTVSFCNARPSARSTSRNTVCLQLMRLAPEGDSMHAATAEDLEEQQHIWAASGCPGEVVWELDSLPGGTSPSAEWTAAQPGCYLVRSEVYPFIQGAIRAVPQDAGSQESHPRAVAQPSSGQLEQLRALSSRHLGQDDASQGLPARVCSSAAGAPPEARTPSPALGAPFPPSQLQPQPTHAQRPQPQASAFQPASSSSPSLPSSPCKPCSSPSRTGYGMLLSGSTRAGSSASSSRSGPSPSLVPAAAASPPRAALADARSVYEAGLAAGPASSGSAGCASDNSSVGSSSTMSLEVGGPIGWGASSRTSLACTPRPLNSPLGAGPGSATTMGPGPSAFSIAAAAAAVAAAPHRTAATVGRPLLHSGGPTATAAVAQAWLPAELGDEQDEEAGRSRPRNGSLDSPVEESGTPNWDRGKGEVGPAAESGSGAHERTQASAAGDAGGSPDAAGEQVQEGELVAQRSQESASGKEAGGDEDSWGNAAAPARCVPGDLGLWRGPSDAARSGVTTVSTYAGPVSLDDGEEDDWALPGDRPTPMQVDDEGVEMTELCGLKPLQAGAASGLPREGLRPSWQQAGRGDGPSARQGWQPGAAVRAVGQQASSSSVLGFGGLGSDEDGTSAGADASVGSGWPRGMGMGADLRDLEMGRGMANSLEAASAAAMVGVGDGIKGRNGDAPGALESDDSAKPEDDYFMRILRDQRRLLDRERALANGTPLKEPEAEEEARDRAEEESTRRKWLPPDGSRPKMHPCAGCTSQFIAELNAKRCAASHAPPVSLRNAKDRRSASAQQALALKAQERRRAQMAQAHDQIKADMQAFYTGASVEDKAAMVSLHSQGKQADLIMHTFLNTTLELPDPYVIGGGKLYKVILDCRDALRQGRSHAELERIVPLKWDALYSLLHDASEGTACGSTHDAPPPGWPYPFQLRELLAQNSSAAALELLFEKSVCDAMHKARESSVGVTKHDAQRRREEVERREAEMEAERKNAELEEAERKEVDAKEAERKPSKKDKRSKAKKAAQAQGQAQPGQDKPGSAIPDAATAPVAASTSSSAPAAPAPAPAAPAAAPVSGNGNVELSIGAESSQGSLQPPVQTPDEEDGQEPEGEEGEDEDDVAWAMRRLQVSAGGQHAAAGRGGGGGGGKAACTVAGGKGKGQGGAPQAVQASGSAPPTASTKMPSQQIKGVTVPGSAPNAPGQPPMATATTLSAAASASKPASAAPASAAPASTTTPGVGSTRTASGAGKAGPSSLMGAASAAMAPAVARLSGAVGPTLATTTSAPTAAPAATAPASRKPQVSAVAAPAPSAGSRPGSGPASGPGPSSTSAGERGRTPTAPAAPVSGTGGPAGAASGVAAAAAASAAAAGPSGRSTAAHRASSPAPPAPAPAPASGSGHGAVGGSSRNGIRSSYSTALGASAPSSSGSTAASAATTPSPAPVAKTAYVGALPASTAGSASQTPQLPQPQRPAPAGVSAPSPAPRPSPAPAPAPTATTLAEPSAAAAAAAAMTTAAPAPAPVPAAPVPAAAAPAPVPAARVPAAAAPAPVPAAQVPAAAAPAPAAATQTTVDTAVHVPVPEPEPSASEVQTPAETTATAAVPVLMPVPGPPTAPLAAGAASAPAAALTSSAAKAPAAAPRPPTEPQSAVPAAGTSVPAGLTPAAPAASPLHKTFDRLGHPPQAPSVQPPPIAATAEPYTAPDASAGTSAPPQSARPIPSLHPAAPCLDAAAPSSAPSQPMGPPARPEAAAPSDTPGLPPPGVMYAIHPGQYPGPHQPMYMMHPGYYQPMYMHQGPQPPVHMYSPGYVQSVEQYGMAPHQQHPVQFVGMPQGAMAPGGSPQPYGMVGGQQLVVFMTPMHPHMHSGMAHAPAAAAAGGSDGGAGAGAWTGASAASPVSMPAPSASGEAHATGGGALHYQQQQGVPPDASQPATSQRVSDGGGIRPPDTTQRTMPGPQPGASQGHGHGSPPAPVQHHGAPYLATAFGPGGAQGSGAPRPPYVQPSVPGHVVAMGYPVAAFEVVPIDALSAEAQLPGGPPAGGLPPAPPGLLHAQGGLSIAPAGPASVPGGLPHAQAGLPSAPLPAQPGRSLGAPQAPPQPAPVPHGAAPVAGAKPAAPAPLKAFTPQQPLPQHQRHPAYPGPGMQPHFAPQPFYGHMPYRPQTQHHMQHQLHHQQQYQQRHQGVQQHYQTMGYASQQSAPYYAPRPAAHAGVAPVHQAPPHAYQNNAPQSAASTLRPEMAAASEARVVGGGAAGGEGNYPPHKRQQHMQQPQQPQQTQAANSVMSSSMPQSSPPPPVAGEPASSAPAPAPTPAPSAATHISAPAPAVAAVGNIKTRREPGLETELETETQLDVPRVATPSGDAAVAGYSRREHANGIGASRLAPHGSEDVADESGPTSSCVAATPAALARAPETREQEQQRKSNFSQLLSGAFHKDQQQGAQPAGQAAAHVQAHEEDGRQQQQRVAANEASPSPISSPQAHQAPRHAWPEDSVTQAGQRHPNRVDEAPPVPPPPAPRRFDPGRAARELGGRWQAAQVHRAEDGQ